MSAFDVVVHTSLPDATVLAAGEQLYTAAFAEPPYRHGAAEAAHFREQIERYAAEREGFRLAVASRGDAVIGAVLAVTGRPGDWWRDRVAAVLGQDGAARWLGDRCSEIVTVAVDPAHRRAGVAGRLLGTLGDDAATAGLRTAVLSCWLSATGAWTTYARLGWTELSRDLVTREGGPPLGVYARALTDRLTTGPGQPNAPATG